MLSDFLNHTVDIYHATRQSVDAGYGLTAGFRCVYADEPDIKGQKCHVNVKGTGTISASQEDPFNAFGGRIKLVVPLGTDLRTNDKIYVPEIDMEFVVEIPRTVQNHHIFAYIKRIDGTGEYI